MDEFEVQRWQRSLLAPGVAEPRPNPFYGANEEVIRRDAPGWLSDVKIAELERELRDRGHDVG